MAKQVINRGTSAGDGTGESLFDAYGKCINNFDELYQNWTDLAATSATNGASMVGIANQNSNFNTAEDVEAALDEIFSQIASQANAYGASLVGVEDPGDRFDATNVETALAEIYDLAYGTSLSGGLSDNLSLEYDTLVGASAALPTNSGSIRVHSFSDCLIDFSESVGTDSLYFPAGTEVLGVPSGATHISVSGLGVAGCLNVTGLEAPYAFVLTTNTTLHYTAGSNSVALPSGSNIRLFALTDCFIAFGDSSVSADNTSAFFEAGTEIMKVPTGATHIAAKQYTLGGTLYITGVV